MFTKLMKWFATVALFGGALLGSRADYQIILELIVCVAALMVLAQAFRLGKYFWGIGFAAIAVLFNPALPVALSHQVFLLLDLVCTGAFLVSLTTLRWERAVPAPSITGHSLGTEAL